MPRQPAPDTGPVPVVAWTAYHRAAEAVSCGLDWSVLAGIGKVESDHGRYAGSHLTGDGEATAPITGPVFDVAGDRAAGPMQFIASTWSSWAADGNRDGRADVQNVYDAAAAAAQYLCAAGGDLGSAEGLRRAVFAYNHLDSYVTDVLAHAHAYAAGLPESSVQLVPIIDTPTTGPAKPSPRASSTAPRSRPTRTAADEPTQTPATVTTSPATSTPATPTTDTSSAPPATSATVTPSPTGTSSTGASTSMSSTSPSAPVTDTATP